MPEPQISVIVPVINEAENLPLLLSRVDAALKGRQWEMIVVDDDSTDATPDVCAKLAQTYPLMLLRRHNARDGLGGAVVHGFSQARGQYLVCMDADLQHPPEKLPELIKPLEENRADFVLGSRYVPGGGTHERWTIARRINSRVATILAMPFSGPVTDPMSGFFALDRATYERATNLVPLGYKIGLELMCKCRVQKVVEVPILFGERQRGSSKLSLKEQFRYLEHLSRLYDFKYPRLSPVIKFGIVMSLGLILWCSISAILSENNVALAPSVTIAYAAVIVVEAVFHRRYIRTQREFLVTRKPWRDFFMIAALEWLVAAAVAHFAADELKSPNLFLVLLLAFIGAAITRYILRKELYHDIRGLRPQPRDRA